MALHHSVIAYRQEFDILLLIGRKRCTKCNEIRELGLFSKNRRVYGGYSNHCTICLSLGWRVRNSNTVLLSDVENAHRLANEQRELGLSGKRRCTKCREVKDLQLDFPHRLLQWARFKDDCLKCAAEKELKEKTARSKRGAEYRQKHHIKKWADRSIRNHRQRGFEIAVVAADLISLVDQKGFGSCYYTDDLIIVGYGASIDVKDPKGKFEKENICLCSHACNSTKSAMTEIKFVEYLDKNPAILARIKKNNQERLKLYYVRNIPLESLKEMVESWQS